MASRILLADDSITIQKVVNLTFADEGIEVVAVSNGDLAERRLAEISPDLVLADIFMPGKNGYELCEAIKENSQFRNVPVVLLVGAFEPFDQAEASRVRADAHLTKPFESRTLVETVRRLISTSGTTAGPIAPMPATDRGHDEAFDTHSAGTPAAPGASLFAGNLDLSAMAADNVAPLTQVRNTGELASPSPDARQELFDVGVVDASAPDAVGATLTDTGERFEPLEFSPNGDFSPAEVAPPFGLDTLDSHVNEEVQNAETLEHVETAPAQDPIPFETVPSSTLHEVNISGAGEGEHWFNSSSFETSRLDRPSGDGVRRAPANSSPLSYQTPDFTLQTETGYGASETSETACATLLAVDEPLGDLFEGSVSVDSLPPLEMSSSDSLGLEFGEAEVAEVEPSLSTQFDLVEIAESSEAEAPLTLQDELAGAEHLSADAVEQVTAAEVEQVAVEEAPAPEDAREPIAAAQPPDAETVSHELAGDSDWTTPRAASYSTAQLDSVVMPIDAAESLAENVAGEGATQPENAEEASFTTPVTWTEEEAVFTPIDIEAVAVEETPSEAREASSPIPSADPMAAEQPVASRETLVAQGAEEPAIEHAGAALSPAAIEEIVRRVVAEMSDSVVREVAWEVVPDCVERVIEQLTRESLEKRG